MRQERMGEGIPAAVLLLSTSDVALFRGKALLTAANDATTSPAAALPAR